MAIIRKIVEYKLWLNDKGEKIIPPFIKDGGYYLKDDGTMVGVLEADHDVYIPDAFTDVSKDDLTSRISELRANEIIANDIPQLPSRLSVDEEVNFFLSKV